MSKQKVILKFVKKTKFHALIVLGNEGKDEKLFSQEQVIRKLMYLGLEEKITTRELVEIVNLMTEEKRLPLFID